jgi:hypothetical protein
MSGTGKSGPSLIASSTGSISARWLQSLHQAISRTLAAAALPSVIGPVALLLTLGCLVGDRDGRATR